MAKVKCKKYDFVNNRIASSLIQINEGSSIAKPMGVGKTIVVQKNKLLINLKDSLELHFS